MGVCSTDARTGHASASGNSVGNTETTPELAKCADSLRLGFVSWDRSEGYP